MDKKLLVVQGGDRNIRSLGSLYNIAYSNLGFDKGYDLAEIYSQFLSFFSKIKEYGMALMDGLEFPRSIGKETSEEKIETGIQVVEAIKEVDLPLVVLLNREYEKDELVQRVLKMMNSSIGSMDRVLLKQAQKAEVYRKIGKQYLDRFSGARK